MALDVNVYADKKDYELELEVSDAKKGKDDFDAFLKENNIDFKYAKSKVARFVATLKRDKDQLVKCEFIEIPLVIFDTF